MKDKRLSVIAVLLLLSSVLKAESPLLHYGIEWGGGSSIAEYHHYNYISSVGRVNDASGSLCFRPNAYIHAYIGLGIIDKMMISLKSGYEGVYVDREMIPILLRFQLSPRGLSKDGGLYFMEGGPAIPIIHKQNTLLCVTGSIGGGYKWTITSHSSLDIIGGLRLSYDRPGIWNEYDSRWADDSEIRRNNAIYFGLTLGLALNF